MGVISGMAIWGGLFIVLWLGCAAVKMALAEYQR